MIVKWAFLALSFLAATNAEIFIGPLITKAHLVGGDVYLLSDKVLEIRNYVYDGDGPAAFFWADTNPNPTRQGRVIPDASPSLGCNLNAQGTALPRAQGITQRVEFPEGESFQDYLGGSLSVWCEAFNANFGHVSFPSSIDSSALTAVATECVFTEVEPIAAAIATTPDAYNCEPMNDRFQVRWSVDGNDLHVELVGRIEDGTYMGFGISGSSTETWMLGADAVVVDYVDGQPRATDIFIDSRAQCNGETGVCPDSTMGFTNDISNVSGEQDCGVTLVRYTRPLTPSDLTMLMGLQGDAPVDKTIDVTVCFVVL